MEEAELVSELLAAALDGLQNGKKTLDSFYSQYDESFEQRDELVKRFKNIIAEISECFGSLADTEFHRPPLFYTLFCAVYHYKYGLPKTTLKRPAKVDVALSEHSRQRLSQAVTYLSEALESGEEGPVVEESVMPFITAAARHTDDQKPRQKRLEVLYGRAFL